MRVVLITGAAGGLGRGLAAEFAAQGWRVAAAWHRASDFVESERLWPVRLDVTSPTEAQNVTGQVLARWGRIDVLVNNAGITADQPLWQMEESDWDRVLAVNLTGARRCARAVLGPMIARREGHILNISSFSGRSGQRGQSNYAAAKAGLLGLTAALAREVGEHNIRVNAVLPGVLPTPMTARLKESDLARFASANALGRLNTVAEVARFIVFLAQTQNISGQLFQLDSRIGPWT